jgi:hypothetical protein
MTAAADGQSIDRDVDCVACGYNLRGLRDDGICPECGGRVADSLGDRGVGAANGPWRRAVRLGVAVGAAEYVLMMVIVPLVQVADVERYAKALIGAMAASAVLGGWWVGRREPGVVQGGKLRVGLRGATLAAGGGYVLMLVMDAGWWPAWYRAAAIAFLTANAVKSGLQMAVLTRVAGRTADARLGRVGRWMTGVGPAVWGLMLLEQFNWSWAWVDWAIVAGVALASLGVVAYSACLYRAMRRRAGGCGRMTCV